MTAAITGFGIRFPPPMRQRELWDGFFAAHFGGSRRARALFLRAGAETRHGVANPLVEDISGWSTGHRMRRYAAEALPLGKDAVAAALDDAGLSASDVGLLAVCSCTGYASPGLDVLLARDLGMPPDVRRLSIGHMGCYAALPGLGAAADYVTGHRRPAVLLCVELTSLHIQPPTDDLDQVVSHALFSDAAAAVVVSPGGAGIEVRDVICRTDFAAADQMSWEVTDLGFRMGLSPRVPDVLAGQLATAVGELLRPYDLSVSDVGGWAVHPGGPRILDVTREALALPGDALAVSHQVLAEHGNCSSTTVLVVLRETARRAVAGSHLVAMAFGPGLTLYAALLRTTA